MSEKDITYIKDLAQNHTLEPRPEAWEKLNSKLKSKKDKVRLLTYRNISIAAILISIVSVTAVFSLYLGEHNPEVFASNEDYRPIVLEELSVVEIDPLFDVADISKLKDAYLNDIASEIYY